MGNPLVYYRIDTLAELKCHRSYCVRSLDWYADLEMIQRFYTQFNKTIRPDEFEQYVGNPVAIIQKGDIVCLAIPLTFQKGETEIGGVATVPDRRNEGYCKALLSEMAAKILEEGKAATLTTEKDNLAMQRVAERIGMKRISENR